MQKHLNVIYLVVLMALIIFAIKLQLLTQTKDIQQILKNQTTAIELLRADINNIAAFLNGQTNVKVEIRESEK
ncbi:hypothetical protein KKG71_05660 [Patescibacteria group bacterium]|nr:hypothetical protein [Patescibacteria group bacterium]